MNISQILEDFKSCVDANLGKNTPCKIYVEQTSWNKQITIKGYYEGCPEFIEATSYEELMHKTRNLFVKFEKEKDVEIC